MNMQLSYTSHLEQSRNGHGSVELVVGVLGRQRDGTGRVGQVRVGLAQRHTEDVLQGVQDARHLALGVQGRFGLLGPLLAFLDLLLRGPLEDAEAVLELGVLSAQFLYLRRNLNKRHE